MLRRSQLRTFSYLAIVLILMSLDTTQPSLAKVSEPLVVVPAAPRYSANVPHSGIVSVTTRSYDLGRTGANLKESVLSTTNVVSGTFGKLFQREVDGDIYAQPLYLSNQNISYTRNVVYVATEHNSVYAFDADDPKTIAPIWQTNLGTSGKNATNDYGLRYGVPYHDIQKEVGTTGTPIIDAASNTMYVVSFSCVVTHSTPAQFCDPNTVTPPAPRYYEHLLHALDTKTGAEKFGGPIRITGEVAGTGAASIIVTDSVSPLITRSIVPFDSKQHLQRGGLALANGNLYIPFAGFADTNPYHGWIMVYDPFTLEQTAIWNTTPNSGRPVPGVNDNDGEGGIWQSGQGLTVDAGGNIYVMTGNGTFDADTSTNPDPKQINYGDAFVKVDTRHSDAVPIDWFAPNCQGWLQRVDADLGSGGSIVIPGTNLLVGAGKQGNLYVLNQNNLGGYHPPSQVQDSQQDCYDNNEVPFMYDRIDNAVSGGMYGSPVFWQSPTGKRIYTWTQNDKLKAFEMNSTTTFSHTPVVSGSLRLTNAMPGGMLALSANGSRSGTGIMWAVHSTNGSSNASTKTGILRAYNAETLQELWNSEMNNRDSLNIGNGTQLSYMSKFNIPTVANGKVFIPTFAPGGTQAEPSLNVGQPAFLMVYGLRASQVTKPTDDGLLGSLSFALTNSPPNQIISLSPTGTQTINVPNGLPNVPPGVTLKSSCGVGGAGVTLLYTGANPTMEGLQLTRNIWLYGIRIAGFPGRPLVIPNGGGNVANCIVVSKT